MPFQPNSPDYRPPKRTKQKLTIPYRYILQAANVSSNTLTAAIKRKEIDPVDLKSIAYFIVRRTI